MRPGFAARKNKFGAIRTEVDGVSFASKHEARRFMDLKLMERAGEITSLELQPRFKLEVGGSLICTYVADFRYRTRTGHVVIEDAKGLETPTFVIKRKLMKAIHGIEVVTV